ncbi:MAG: hypothetical protein OEY06_00415 [Gammaproteobacteria bacterium]|nr:hypothetical protein [Gammaproteobacteria bacterium]
MEFDQSDWGVTLLLVILGISVAIAAVVIAKAFANESKENKARAARLAEEDKKMAREPQAHVPAKIKPKAKPKTKTPPKPSATPAPAHKDDVHEDDDLIAAAEVYLTYELVEQAITSLEKHLLTHPTDKKALAMLKKAEAAK